MSRLLPILSGPNRLSGPIYSQLSIPLFTGCNHRICPRYQSCPGHIRGFSGNAAVNSRYPLPSCSRNEVVAHTWYGDKVLRLFGVFFQFAAQPADEDGQVLLLTRVLCTPHLLQQHLMSKYFVNIHCQCLQQGILGRGHCDFRTPDGYPPLEEVNLYFATG